MGGIMSEDEIKAKVIEILMRYNKSELKAEAMSPETTILQDLKINSARLVDIVLDFEDVFNIQVADEEADKVESVGDCIKLITTKK